MAAAHQRFDLVGFDVNVGHRIPLLEPVDFDFLLVRLKFRIPGDEFSFLIRGQCGGEGGPNPTRAIAGLESPAHKPTLNGGRNAAAPS